MNDLNLYYKYRSQMQTGDLLIYCTQGVISGMIRWWSPNANHAGMILNLEEYQGEEFRRWTLEATAKGPRTAYLSRLLEHVNGKVYWHPLKPEFNYARNAIGCFALEQVGVVEYDFISLFKNIFGTVSADLRKLYCSEYVFFSWLKGGIITGDKAPYPSDLPLFGVTLPPVLILETSYVEIIQPPDVVLP
jgi:hypothetical protein